MINNYEDFKKQVFSITSIDLNAYKEKQMKRAVFMRKTARSLLKAPAFRQQSRPAESNAGRLCFYSIGMETSPMVTEAMSSSGITVSNVP